MRKLKWATVTLIIGALMLIAGFSGRLFANASTISSEMIVNIVRVAIYVGAGLIVLSIILFILATGRRE